MVTRRLTCYDITDNGERNIVPDVLSRCRLVDHRQVNRCGALVVRCCGELTSVNYSGPFAFSPEFNSFVPPCLRGEQASPSSPKSYPRPRTRDTPSSHLRSSTWLETSRCPPAPHPTAPCNTPSSTAPTAPAHHRFQTRRKSGHPGRAVSGTRGIALSPRHSWLGG